MKPANHDNSQYSFPSLIKLGRPMALSSLGFVATTFLYHQFIAITLKERPIRLKAIVKEVMNQTNYQTR